MAKRAEQEVLGEAPVARVAADVQAALRRKPAQEARLAGALRALAPLSPELRNVALAGVDTLIRRQSFARPLYAGAIRMLAELGDRRTSSPLKKALMCEEAGTLATLSAACFSADSGLAQALAKVATSRHPHLAFAADVARVARGESNGQHVASLAPKIKESHRIALCVETFVPLLWRPALPLAIAPALSVLRRAERHLGRWLVLAEIGVRAGDRRPVEEAQERSSEGPGTARAAWTMVAWALDPDSVPAPNIRPTVELVSRLSDRPSADRDTTFLFRLAAHGVASARPMLENAAKGSTLSDGTAVRAALYLARDHGRRELVEQLSDAAKNTRKEALRGLAAAALFDIGEATGLEAVAAELIGSRQLPTVAWGALLGAALAGNLSGPIVTEPNYRRIQLGWVE